MDMTVGVQLENAGVQKIPWFKGNELQNPISPRQRSSQIKADADVFILKNDCRNKHYPTLESGQNRERPEDKTETGF